MRKPPVPEKLNKLLLVQKRSLFVAVRAVFFLGVSRILLRIRIVGGILFAAPLVVGVVVALRAVLLLIVIGILLVSIAGILLFRAALVVKFVL